MKVSFVGSFSTGKTTMANLFAREWEVPLLPEAARQVAELGFRLDKDANAETETLIFLKTLRAELTHPRFVADRSLVDMLAYADWVMDHKTERRKEDHLWFEAREIAVLDLRARYDHVFYLPIEFPIVLDGLRPDDTDFQAEIDRRMRVLLETHDVEHHSLTGSIDERAEQVRKLVGRSSPTGL
ncbi:MAG: AAA family ATPase [Acidimicrobiales bacterium]